MNFHILTLFPEMVMQGLNTSITGRAIKQNKIAVEAINIRDFSENKHRKVDDYTYGGGAGMLMQPQPVYDAYKQVLAQIPENNGAAKKKLRTIYVTPQGQTFHQHMAMDFAQEEDLVILCGHYEGIDERVLEEIVTDYVSIGDYVLTGGELAAMVMVDAIARLVPGVLNNEVSAETESFHKNLLEYPQYSRPEVWHGKPVPKVLLSGNQKEINAWRLEKSIWRTRKRRPDLYEQYKKLDSCATELLEQKLLHMDMLELIQRGNAKLIFHHEKEILLKDVITQDYFYSSKGSIEAFCHLEESVLSEMQNLYVHQEEVAALIAQNMPFTQKQWICQLTCTRREKLSVSGLYRPDKKPMTCGCKGLIMVPGEKRRVYACLETPDVIMGYVDVNARGCIDTLFVKEEYRGQKVGKALATYMVNQQLEQQITPYVQLATNQLAERMLFENIGLYSAKSAIIKMQRDVK